MSESNKKILIVEDERPLAKALELKLTHEGFDVDSAPNGELAIEAIHKNKYDLVILDIIMPKMNGFEVLEKLHKEKTYIIVLSNLTQDEDKKKAMEMGAKEFFIKSNTPITKIVSNIKNILK